MKYLIIGASSGLGKALAYAFARNNHDLILVSRDVRDLSALKTDIENKYKIQVEALEIDLNLNDQIESKLFKDKYFKEIQGIIFPIGMMLDNDEDGLSFERINNLMNANYTSVSYIISNFSKYLNSKKGEIIGFGSISGYLGRKINPYYSASKRALESYFESLAFLNKKNELRIQFYVLGYLNTNLAFGKNLKLPKGSPQKLANIVYRNKHYKFKKLFFPAWWKPIAFILKIVPFNIFLLVDKIFK